jgi:hypothetical protein
MLSQLGSIANYESVKRGLVLTIVFGVSYFLFSVFTAKLPFAYAVGCDPFGYVRQTELIRQNGLLKGLDTEIKAPEIVFLKKIASEINPNPRTWAEMIAPHCHHYRQATDKVVMQYPPGTGIVLALMPSSKVLQALSIGMTLSIVLVYAYLCLSAIGFKAIVLSTTVVTLLLSIVSRFQVASYSVPVSVLLVAGLIILLNINRSSRQPFNAVVAAAIGLLTGLLIDVRIASVLLLPAIAAMFFLRLEQEPSDRKRYYEIAIAFVSFLIASAPLLLANKLNAGSMFATTYGEYDTSVQWTNTALLMKNLDYYFLGNHPGAPFAAMSIVLIFVLGVIESLRARPTGTSFFRLRGSTRHSVYLVLLATVLLNIVFYAVKPIAMDYYLVPLLTLCTLASLTLIVSTSKQAGGLFNSRTQSLILIVLLLSGLAIGFERLSREEPANISLSVPRELLDHSSIVYADTSGGTIYQYAGKYTKKIAFGSSCMQEQLVHAVARAGRKQFFVVDSAKMEEAVRRLGADHFVDIGNVKSAHIDFPVFEYKQTNSESFPKINCDFGSDPKVVSQIELKANGEVQTNRFVGSVELVNRSTQAFSTRPNSFPIRLAWRVVRSGDEVRVGSEWPNRMELNLMLSPDQPARVPISIPLPPESGEYRIDFTLVQEGLAWFHDRGMRIATLIIHK